LLLHAFIEKQSIIKLPETILNTRVLALNEYPGKAYPDISRSSDISRVLGYPDYPGINRTSVNTQAFAQNIQVATFNTIYSLISVKLLTEYIINYTEYYSLSYD
jgi:hypothetical protein